MCYPNLDKEIISILIVVGATDIDDKVQRSCVLSDKRANGGSLKNPLCLSSNKEMGGRKGN